MLTLPMVRAVAVACFALLLTGMQCESLVHQVEHLRETLHAGERAGLQASASSECLECALLAGNNGVPAPAELQATAWGSTAHVACAAEPPRAVGPHASYRIRAPPPVL